LAERAGSPPGEASWAELSFEEAVEAVVEALKPPIVLPAFARALPP